MVGTSNGHWIFVYISFAFMNIIVTVGWKHNPQSYWTIPVPSGVANQRQIHHLSPRGLGEPRFHGFPWESKRGISPIFGRSQITCSAFIWWFPKLGVPPSPVLIYFCLGCSMKSANQLLYRHDYGTPWLYGGFHSHGGTPNGLLIRENPNLKWMMTGGTPMTWETSIWSFWWDTWWTIINWPSLTFISRILTVNVSPCRPWQSPGNWPSPQGGDPSGHRCCRRHLTSGFP